MNYITAKKSFLRADESSRRIYADTKLLPLRNKEFSLLLYFMRNVGKVVTRTQLLEDVWDRNICCDTNTVDVHVSSLRQKLRKFFKIQLIKTVHCIGYMFEISSE